MTRNDANGLRYVLLAGKFEASDELSEFEASFLSLEFCEILSECEASFITLEFSEGLSAPEALMIDFDSRMH